MVNLVRKTVGVSPFEGLMAYFILFYSALVFCLPMPSTDEYLMQYPWWAKKIEVGNIQLFELVFIGWCFFYIGKLQTLLLSAHTATARKSICWLLFLAIWCGLISLMAPLPFLDLGRTFRLIVIVLLFLAIVNWAYKTENLLLEAMVTGFLVGTIINLIISFQYPLIVVGVLRLSGQNTAGVAMGLAIHLSAWLYYRTDKLYIRAFSVLSSLIFFFSCAISFSRIGWFTAFFGLIAWVYVFWRRFAHNSKRQKRAININSLIILLITFFFLLTLYAEFGLYIIQWLGELLDQKLERHGESNNQRWAYVMGTAEILLEHPLGVGYSGFYDAMVDTSTHSGEQAAVEDDPVSANPHASFLWYATAGGIPGGILFFGALFSILNIMRNGLKRSMGGAGAVFFTLVLAPYLLIGSTVSYLFNSLILIAPAAIAAGWGLSRQHLQRFTVADRTPLQ
jgi:hypothetical protein